jgi:hypothetical protein
MNDVIEQYQFIDIVMTILIFLKRRKAYKINNDTIETQNNNGDHILIDVNENNTYSDKTIEIAKKIYAKRNSIYNRLFKYCIMNDGLPYESTDKQLYLYVKRNVTLYKNDNLANDRIDILESIPYWKWEYIQLSDKGKEYNDAIMNIRNNIPLNDENKRSLIRMKHEYDLDMLDPYFKGTMIMMKDKINKYLRNSNTID